MHVVFFHVGTTVASRAGWIGATLAKSGYAAVGLFYILSGFVLCYSYTGRPHDPAGFRKARFARIYPLYLFSLILALPAFLTHLSGQKHSASWLAAVLLTTPAGVQAWFPSLALAWNTPAWSLSVEFFFYFLFPFLLGPISGLSRARQAALIACLFVLSITPSLIYCLVSSMPFAALTSAPHTYWQTLESNGWVAVLNFNPLLRLPEFASGIALGCLFLSRRQDGLDRWLDWAAGISAAAIVMFLATPNLLPYPVVHNGVLLPVWCVLIYSLAGSKLFGRLLSWKALIVLGEASYAMYILQQPISTLFKAVMLHWRHIRLIGDYPAAPLLGAYLILLCGISVLSHYLLEMPLRRAILTRFSRAKNETRPMSRATPASV